MKLSHIRAIMLDLDGVVYLEGKPLPGVPGAIEKLRARGLRVLFVTNNAADTREGFARHLSRLGIPCAPREIMNAAHAAALVLKNRFPRGARMFVFGKSGLARELSRAGFRPFTLHSRSEWEAFRQRGCRTIRAVVVAFDRSITYWSMCAATRALERGARLVASNLDSSYPAHGGIMPGTGSLVRLLEVASGRPPLLIGKPSPLMFRLLLREHGIAPENALVVGDRIEIDIRAGKVLGAATALVLTGIATRRDATRAKLKPDLVLDSLRELVRLRELGTPA
jgi:phosphoglycolate/pyridoxal phosphate phosphatase family enzyme